jgi:hypothetical protein
VAVDVDLEVKVTADGPCIASRPDGADALSGPDGLAGLDCSGPDKVGVEVAAVLALAVDQQVVAVENRVVSSAQDSAGRGRNQRRTAAGDDIEAFVDTAATARRAELTDVAARPVRPQDREDVGVELGSAAAGGRLGRCRRSERGKKNEDDEERALQWCAMTRSTRLYSFASSAVMK